MLALRQQMEGKVSETTNEVQLCLSLTLIASFMAEHAPLHRSAVLLHVHVHTAHSLQTPWQRKQLFQPVYWPKTITNVIK